MNQKEIYEIIIAQKLEQLPVPAMEDAIWNRISAQLDIEMPQTTPPDNTPPDNNTFLNIATLFVLITALSCYLYIQFFHQAPQQVIPATMPAPAPTIKDSVWHELPPVPSLHKTPLPEERDDEKKTSLPPDTVNALQSVIVTPVMDSIVTDPPEQVIAPPVIVPPPAADTTPKKKPKGVKGIKNDDYRIAPKKH